MPKKITYKRLSFPRGKQNLFITRSMKILKMNNEKFANLLKVSLRTITDWKREKFLISLNKALLISKKAKIPIPKEVKIKNPFWYIHKGAKLGGLNMYKKYGCVGLNPEKRLIKWREWWEKEGKFKKHPIINVRLSIKKPKESKSLAEFTGIIIGDGGISKNQTTITLHHIDDKKYAEFVIKLIKKLFGVKPSVYHYPKKSVNDIVISRIKLTEFLTEKMGFKIGSKTKQQIDIPDWIKQNNNFQIACLRGLIDTDGSIFKHTYKVNGKYYTYKKMDFTNSSKPLRKSVYIIMKKIGLNPRLSQNKSIRLDSINDMAKYFSIVGSHNPKHLRHYLK